MTPMAYKTNTVIGILLAGLLISASATAQKSGGVFRWVDKEGQVHFTKTLPPEYADLPYQRINETGIVVETVAGAISQKELAEQAAAELRVLEEQKEREKLYRENRALLVKYSSLQALEESLAFNLQRVGGDITIAQTMYDAQIEALASEVRHAANLQRTGAAVTAQLQTRVANLQAGINSHQKRIDTLQLSLEATKNKFEQDRIRYLGIKEK